MRRQIILAAPPGKIKQRTSECEVPNEYECCYCDSKVDEQDQMLLSSNFYFATLLCTLFVCSLEFLRRELTQLSHPHHKLCLFVSLRRCCKFILV